MEVVATLADGRDGRPSLDGLMVECGSGVPQPATLPLTCSVPKQSGEAQFALSNASVPSPVAHASAPAVSRGDAVGARISAPPVCVAGAVQVAEGPFGDEAAARVEVAGRGASVIAESPRAVFWGLPAGTPVGENRMVVRAGGRSVSLPIWVVRLSLSADRLSLASGESTAFHARLSGLENVPEEVWRRGIAPSLLDAGRVARLSPAFARMEGASAGVILLAIENASRDAISLENSVDERIVVPVSREDLGTGGDFRFDGVIRSRRAGTFSVSAAVLPLLRSIPGKDLEDESAKPPAARP